VPLGKVGGVGGDLVGDDAGLHIVLVWQAQVFLGRDVAQHGCAVPGDFGRADGRGDVVVAGGHVRDQRAQCVEGRTLAELLLAFNVLAHQVERDVPRPFHHDLDVVLPGPLGQLSQGVQFGELRGVVGVGRRARPEAVAQ
jgi:hypothetical protein